MAWKAALVADCTARLAVGGTVEVELAEVAYGCLQREELGQVSSDTALAVRSSAAEQCDIQVDWKPAFPGIELEAEVVMYDIPRVEELSEERNSKRTAVDTAAEVPVVAQT